MSSRHALNKVRILASSSSKKLFKNNNNSNKPILPPANSNYKFVNFFSTQEKPNNANSGTAASPPPHAALSADEKLRKYNENSKKSNSKGNRFFWKTIVFGGIVFAVAYVGAGELEHYLEHKEDKSGKPKPRIVVLGTGWASVAFLDSIDTKSYEVVVISPRNYFLFTPLLASTTVGTTDSRSIIEPIRRFLSRRKPNVKFYEASCIDIDPDTQTVFCQDTSDFVVKRAPIEDQPKVQRQEQQDQLNQGLRPPPRVIPDESDPSKFALHYDHLVVSVGAINNTYNTKGVQQFCYFLKQIEDARKIRSRILDILESASFPNVSPDDRKRVLNFLVVGGGPTGIEFAGELRDFIQSDVVKLFPHLLKDIRITLVQSADHVLNTYDQSISEYTEKTFKTNGINILTNTRVLEVRDGEVEVLDKKKGAKEVIPFGCCVWSTGIEMHPLCAKLVDKLPKKDQNNNKALLTNARLQVKGAKPGSLYAMGDCANVEQPSLIAKLIDLFQEADTDKSNTISMDEFEKLVISKADDYPQLAFYGRKMKKFFAEIDKNKDDQLSMEEFKDLLALADRNLKSLPATAQCASQMGSYLAKAMNLRARDDHAHIPSFNYVHSGSLAYVGSSKAVADIPHMKLSGFHAWLLWRAAYWSKQVSWKNRVSITTDWAKQYLFGRDCSRF